MITRRTVLLTLAVNRERMRENLQPLVRDWMRSEGHRKNILSTRYTHSGVGVTEGRAGLLTITQMFASFSP